MFRRLIIFLFEKYAYDEWQNIQLRKAQESISDEYEIPLEEVSNFVDDRSRERRIENHNRFAEEMQQKGTQAAIF